MLAPSTIEIVKATVPVIEQYGAEVTAVFYQNILRENPSLNAVFNQGNQASGNQPKALATAVLAYAKYIETPEVLSQAIKHITQKHASLFIKAEHYPIVGQYLLGAFTQVLGEAFTPEIHDAWAEAYGQLAQIMIDAEAKLYKEAAGWTDWRDFTVESKIQESSEITSFTMAPKDGRSLPSFLPGQYISVRVFIPSLGYTQIRQYSLSDSYTPAYYRISVKREAGVTVKDVANPGLVSTVLHTEIQVGDTLQLSMPQGHFTLDPNTTTTPTANTSSPSPVILISAGVGITPLLSMLNTTLQNSSSSRPTPITFIHGSRTATTRAFARHIDTITSAHANVRRVQFLTQVSDSDQLGVDYDHVGRVDLGKCDVDAELWLADKSARYYVCGPDGFMSDIKAWLENNGVNGEQVDMEKFGTGGF